MTGIQAWVLCLIEVRSASAYQEIAPMLEMIRVIGNSYRLASSGVGSGVLYGRFAIGFCRALLIGVVGNFASRRLRQASATLGARFRHRGRGLRVIDASTRSRHSGWPAASTDQAISDLAATAQWRGVYD